MPCPSLTLPQKALFKGYTAPALPKAAYVHGVDDKGHQGAMARESRRIVLRCACCTWCTASSVDLLLFGPGVCRAVLLCSLQLC